MVKTVRLASDLQTDSIVDGDGIRTVIWFQGCPHNCPECHNPESHDFSGGTEYLIDDILKHMESLENQKGITFSGGEPMMQPEALVIIAKKAKELGLDIWSWSGFTFEELLEFSKNKPIYKEVLENIDILVDGRFEIALKSFSVKFRGSSNQRILDVKKSMQKKKAISYAKYQ